VPAAVRALGTLTIARSRAAGQHRAGGAKTLADVRTIALPAAMLAALHAHRAASGAGPDQLGLVLVRSALGGGVAVGGGGLLLGDRADLAAADRLLEAWVAEHLAPLRPGAPQVTGGEVVAQKGR